MAGDRLGQLTFIRGLDELVAEFNCKDRVTRCREVAAAAPKPACWLLPVLRSPIKVGVSPLLTHARALS